MRFGQQVANGAVRVHASSPCGLFVISVVGDLQLPRMGATGLHEFLLRILPKGKDALLYFCFLSL